MVLQETYGIIDAIFKDIGTTTKYGVWTSTDFTDATRITRTNGYTILTPQDNYDSQTENISLTDFAVEFSCSLIYTNGTSQNAFLRMLASSNRSFHPDKLDIQSNKWYNLRFVVRNGVIKSFVDGVEKSSESISEVTAFRMVLNNNYVSSMKYNNFVVYPI